MLINLSNKPNRYGQVGRRIEYTGDMANPAGVGAIVAENGGEAPSVEDYRRGRLWNKSPAFSARDWNQVIYQQLAGMEA